MPSQIRIEFLGAMYHVMARGDHSSCCRLTPAGAGAAAKECGEAGNAATDVGNINKP
jgi:hypothetical protein